MPVSQKVINDIGDFHNALTKLEEALDERKKLPLTRQHLEDNPLDRARLDLATLYVLNSAMWIKLCLSGEEPDQIDDLKNEIERIKELSIRMKLIEERQKASRIDTKAAGRFIKHALWEKKDEGDLKDRQTSSKN